MLKKIGRQLSEGKTLLQFGFLKGLVQLVPLIIAKFFSEEIFGVYSLSKMVVFFFITLLITAPQVPFIVYAGRERGQTGKINKSFSIQILFLLFGILAYTAASLIFNRQICKFADITKYELFYLSLAFGGIALNSFYNNLFLALGQRIKNSLSELTYGVIMLMIIIILAATGTLSIKTVFLSYFVSAIITLFIFIGTVDLKQLFPFEFSTPHFRDMFDFTKWVFIGAAATFFIDWGDNAVLKAFNATLMVIGQYSFAYQIYNGLITLIFILNSYFLPFISENLHDRNKMREYLYSKRPRILVLGIIILIITFIACPYVFQIIYKDAYQSSINVLRILLIACALVLYLTFYLPLVNALKLYKFSQTVNIIHMIIKISLSIILVPLYGFYGAAYGTIIAYLFVIGIYEYYYRTKMKKLLFGS